MFKFPSLNTLVNGVLDTLKRFPLPILSASVGSLISIYVFGENWEQKNDLEHLWKIVMCCWLGLNLFLALDLISERRNHTLVQRYLLQFFALVLLIGYYFLLPDFKKITQTDIIRFSLLNIGLHFLVAFSPFISKGEINGFWVFNKTLFIRFLVTGLYSCVLFLGLALALLAVDQLFNANIREERYGQLWFFLAGIFNTWFFLAGIPKNLNELESNRDYPKGLKIFTQFVLLPLVTVYLLILYAYGIKILVQWELPKGWVSYLINAFSVFGILSLLLIYPIRNEHGNTWIGIFSRWFYSALFPLIILLVVSIGTRVLQYGVTENRYFVLVIAFWLVGIAVYFLTSKIKNIKIIPISLCIIAFLSAFGPWSAFSVSKQSQKHRLEKILIEEKILVDGKIIATPDTVTDQNGKQIVSIVDYLGDYHGFDAIQPWFRENLDSLFLPKDSSDFVNEKQTILALIGVEDIYYGGYEYDEQDSVSTTARNFYYNAEPDNQRTIQITGFDYYSDFNQYFSREDIGDIPYSPIYIGKDSAQIECAKDKNEFFLTINGTQILQFNVNDFLEKIVEYKKANKKARHKDFPSDMMIIQAENDSVKIQIHLTSISGTISNDEHTVESMYGTLLLKMGTSSQNTLSNGSVEKH